MPSNRLKKNAYREKKGFSLIELIVAMFILVMVIAAMVSISITVFRSYQKARAIKTIMEDVGYTLNSIAKDVRMGKIEIGNSYADGSAKDYLLVSRNRGGRVCYRINATTVAVADIASGNDCTLSSLTYTNIVNLLGTSLTFDLGKSRFRSCTTDKDGTGPACNSATGKRRGWVEVNLDIENPSMETDAIKVQTIVSSRDYGW